MRKLVIPALLGLAAVLTAPAHALTASGSFDVTVNLYPKCEFTTAPSALTLNYVSFQTVPSENLQNFVLRCTNSLPYTFALSSTLTAPYTLVGLEYSLATTTTAGVASPGGTGSGSNQTYAIKGTIAAGQAGTCAQGNTGNTAAQSASVTGTTAGVGTACTGATTGGAHTLTITY